MRLEPGLAGACCLAAALCLQTCSLPEAPAAPLRITAQTLTLAWDPPEAWGAMVRKYSLYFRQMNGSTWSKLGTSTSTAFEVSQKSVGGNGTYVFGVSAILPDGSESPMHSSLDFSANPAGGWYVFWVLSR